MYFVRDSTSGVKSVTKFTTVRPVRYKTTIYRVPQSSLENKNSMYPHHILSLAVKGQHPHSFRRRSGVPVLGHFPSWTVQDFTSWSPLWSWNTSLLFPSIISINKQTGSRVLPPNTSRLKNKAFPSLTCYGLLPHFCAPFSKKNLQNGKFNFLTLILDLATL